MTFKDQLEAKKLKAAAWRKGKAFYLLDTTQKSMLEAFEASPERIFILLCSRRLGKTWLLLTKAVNTCIEKKQKVIYITDSYKSAKEIVRPTMDKILEECPSSNRPKYKTQDSKYVFPNGSEILLVGSDRNPDSCRGQEANLVIIDEAGFVNNLHYLINSVILPALRFTNGRIFMGTTPPKEEDHDFLQYLAKAETSKAVLVKTIYDCPRMGPKMIAEAMNDAGGEESESWQREYLCKIIRNKDTTVLPEFDDIAQSEIVMPTANNPVMDTYVGMDLGFVDNTGALFGHYDFCRGVFVLKRELLIRKMNTEKIAQEINIIEKGLWPNPPYRRTADCNNPQFIYDLHTLHKLTFNPDPRVGTKEQRINKLRLMIQHREIEIDPSCVNLITQLKYCKWKNSERLSFDRSEQYGHFDLVDALIILINNIDYSRNPVTTQYDIHTTANIPHQPSKNALEKLVPSKMSKIRRMKIWS